MVGGGLENELYRTVPLSPAQTQPRPSQEPHRCFKNVSLKKIKIDFSRRTYVVYQKSLKMSYPVYEHIRTGERFTCILHAMRLGWEWYGFEKKGNIYFGFVMNNIDTIDEFGDFDIKEVMSVCNKKFILLTPQDVSRVIPPIGFKRVN